MKNMSISDLDSLRMWIGRYQDFIVAAVQQLQQANTPEEVQAQFQALLTLFPQNITNMTLNELVANNSQMLQSLAQWIKTVQYQIVNR